MSAAKTLQEHLKFVEEVARLSFRYAWRLQERLPAKSLSEIIRQHTMLYFHILNLPVTETSPELEAVSAQNADEFAEAMWKQGRNFILEKAEKLYPDSIGMPGYIDKPQYGWNCGCLKYDPPRPEPESAGLCVFHIANSTAPESIFDVPGYLLDCFEKLLDDSEKEYGYTTLYTSTWMNDWERFQRYFPQEWHDNMSPRDESVIPGYTIGNWGQLFTARGLLNPKTAAFLEEYGRLKYCSRRSHCSFQSMREHLKFLREKL